MTFPTLRPATIPAKPRSLSGQIRRAFTALPPDTPALEVGPLSDELRRATYRAVQELNRGRSSKVAATRTSGGVLYVERVTTP